MGESVVSMVVPDSFDVSEPLSDPEPLVVFYY